MSEATHPTGGLTRRGFLKGAGAAAGVLGLAGVASMTATDGWLAPAKAHAESEEQIKYTFHQGHCAGWCSLKCTERDGRLCLIEPNEWSNSNHNTVCVKGLSEIQHVYSQERVQTPLKRVGERGKAEFVSISWDEALQLLKDNIGAVREKYGNQAVMVQNTSDARMRFTANVLQAQTGGNGGIDTGLGNGLDQTNGTFMAFGSSLMADWVNTKTMINFGNNVLESRLVHSMHFFNAKDAGCHMITIDPHFSTTAGKSDEWLPIVPGTDAALLLGMITCVLEEKWYDEPYMIEHTSLPFLVDKDTGLLLKTEDAFSQEGSNAGVAGDVGPSYIWYVWDESANECVPYDCEGVSAALSGEWTIEGKRYCTLFDLLVKNQEQYSAAWAANVTGISEEAIVGLTDQYANGGPAVLSLSFGGADKWSNADIVGHAAVLLGSLTGNIGVRGGGVGFYDDACAFSAVRLGAWALPEQYTSAPSPVNLYDMPTTENDVRAIIAFGDTLTMRHPNFSNADRWFKALDYIVLVDIYHTPAELYADLILPACTKFEDVEDVAGIQAKNERVMLQGRVIDPLFDSRTDFEIEKAIAGCFGLDNLLPASASEYVEAQVASAMGLEGVTVQQIYENNGIWEVEVDDLNPVGFGDLTFGTPSGRLEPYYENMLEDGQAFPNYEEPQEAYESNPLKEKYPLQFMQPRTRFHIHEQFCDATWIQQYYQPYLELNPQDMQARGLANGDVVRVFNDRGSFSCKVKGNEAVRPGCSRIYEGMWNKYLEDGCIQNVINGTMNPRGYKMPWGPVIPFNDTLVEVEKAEV